MPSHSSRTARGAVAAVAFAVVLAATPGRPLAGERFRRVESHDAPAEWLAAGGGRIASGSGRRVRVEGRGAGSPVEIDLAVPVSGGAVVGSTLVLVERGGGLAVIELDRPGDGPARVALVPEPKGELRVAALRGGLVVAEDGAGLRFLVLEKRACHEPRPAGRVTLVERAVLPLPERFAALAARSNRAWVALEGGNLLEIDAHDRSAPRIVREILGFGPVRALATDGSRLFLLGDRGLEILDLDGGGDRAGAGVHPGIRGRALHVAGRSLRVGGERGVVRLHDASPAPQLFEVAVEDNFFTPEDLSVSIGDTVRWTNVTGSFHNVFSCTTDQTGCDGFASEESFTSGPASGFWVHDHTFLRAGSNPYVCQPHVPFMIGTVIVTGTAGSPPPVPDGRGGAPMRAGKIAADGSTLSVSWDTTACTGASDHQILHGYGFGLPGSTGGAFELAGSRCSIGDTSPFVWTDAPTAFAVPGGWVYWLVVATDGAVTEGSWGMDSAGQERQGPAAGGSSGQCGIALKNLDNPCAP